MAQRFRLSRANRGLRILAYHGTLRCSHIVESRIRPAECGPPTDTLLLITRKRHVPMALSLFTDVSPFVFSGVYGAVRTVRVGPAGKYALASPP